MSDTPTPETDAQCYDCTYRGDMGSTFTADRGKHDPYGDHVDADFARKLERERDEARAEAAKWKANHDNQVALKSTIIQRPDLRDRAERVTSLIQERNEAIKAIRDADLALRKCLNYLLIQPIFARNNSDIERESETMESVHLALAKLQPFLK